MIPDGTITPEEIIALLNLEPHRKEGGFFSETYRSDEQVAQGALPTRYGGPRALATAIHFLLTPDSYSAMHRLASDEVFHFYRGDPVDMLQLYADGSGCVITLGPAFEKGMHPQLLVPKGVWQGARLQPGGRFALLGATVSPGFEYADYEHGRSDELLTQYPQFREMIVELTSPQQG
ncbi:MAG: cupin domain-containing protein [Candidatus Eisenbacteria sp.]|nr:cupin domain-containing protein [Candidatus Eisenbacteria bacterium]